MRSVFLKGKGVFHSHYSKLVEWRFADHFYMDNCPSPSVIFNSVQTKFMRTILLNAEVILHSHRSKQLKRILEWRFVGYVIILTSIIHHPRLLLSIHFYWKTLESSPQTIRENIWLIFADHFGMHNSSVPSAIINAIIQIEFMRTCLLKDKIKF